MKEYVIEKTVGAPDWTKVSELQVDNVCWLPDAGVRMEQQICHDDEKIYVHLTDKLGSICTDSCMEFFFSPVPEDGRYFNIELNLNGAIFLGFGHGRADSIRLIPEDHKKLFNIRTNKTADGWEIFYEIPLEFLHVFYPDYDFKSGRVIRANCFKCGDLTVQPSSAGLWPHDLRVNRGIQRDIHGLVQYLLPKPAQNCRFSKLQGERISSKIVIMGK